MTTQNKMELSYKQIKGLYENLKNISLTKPHVKFVTWISKNIMALQDEYETLESASKINDSTIKARQVELNERINQINLEITKLGSEYSPEEKEQPGIRSHIQELQKIYQAEKELELNKEFADVRAEKNRVAEEYEEFLKEKVFVKVIKINEDKLPNTFDSLENTSHLGLLINLSEEE